MIAGPDWMPGDEPDELMRSEIISLGARCRKLDAARMEAQSAALLWMVVALCEAGVIVALAVARWKGAA